MNIRSDRFQTQKILEIIEHNSFSVRYYEISWLIYPGSGSLSNAGHFIELPGIFCFFSQDHFHGILHSNNVGLIHCSLFSTSSHQSFWIHYSTSSVHVALLCVCTTFYIHSSSHGKICFFIPKLIKVFLSHAGR